MLTTQDAYNTYAHSELFFDKPVNFSLTSGLYLVLLLWSSSCVVGAGLPFSSFRGVHKFELLNCRVRRPSALSVALSAVAYAAVDFDLESSQQRGLPF